MVKEWINIFLKQHKALYEPFGWPDGSDPITAREFTLGWIEEFTSLSVSQDEAERASRTLRRNPPASLKDHIPAVLAAVEAMRRLRQAPPGSGPPPDSREAARALSKALNDQAGCEHCGSEGLAPVYDPGGGDPARRISASVAAFCVCPHGRWMRAWHATHEPINLRRIPDLADVLTGRSPWLIEQPAPRPSVSVVAPEPVGVGVDEDAAPF